RAFLAWACSTMLVIPYGGILKMSERTREVPDARVRRRQGPGPDPTAPDRGPGTGPAAAGRPGHLLHRCPDPDQRRDKALKGVAVTLLDGHLRHCVRD